MPSTDEKDPATDVSTGSTLALVGESDDLPEESNDLLDLEDQQRVPVLPDAHMAATSPLSATPEQHTKSGVPGKRGGRARTDGLPPGSTAPDKPTPLPRPRFAVFKSDAPNPVQKSKAFYGWWNSTPAWVKDRLICYVYREWPILKMISEEDAGKEYSYIDKISGNEPIQDDNDLLNRYGCGSYKLLLNDSLRGQLSSGTIATVWVIGVGGGDMKSHPPVDRRISDVENVDLTRKENSSYAEFLRMRGQLPEQTRGKEKEMEVATITAVQEMAKQNSDLVEKVIDMARERRDDGGTPVGEAIQVVTDAAKRSNQMLQESHQQAMELMNNKSSSAKDPLDVAIQLVGIINQSKGDGGSSELTELRAEITRLQADRMASLERTIETLRTAPPQNTPSTSVLDSIKALRGMREVVEEFNMGGQPQGNPVAGAVEDAAGDVAPKWLRPFIPVIGAIAQGLIQSRFGQPQQPQQPPSAMGPGGVPYYQQPPPQPPPQQLPPSNVAQMPNANPNGAPTVPVQTSNNGLSPEIQQLLFSIAHPLGTYLHDQTTSGKDFAWWFFAGYGKEVFQTVAGLGPTVVIQAITSFPATVQTTQGVNRIRLEKFVEDFCSATPETEPDDEGDEGEGEQGIGGPVPA